MSKGQRIKGIKTGETCWENGTGYFGSLHEKSPSFIKGLEIGFLKAIRKEAVQDRKRKKGAHP